MVNRTALIVGDCFVGYGQVENVFTVTSFAKVLRAVAAGSKAPDELPMEIRWGQGVGEHERAYILRLIAGLAPQRAIAIAKPRAAPAATRGHVHKRAPQNVLISVPVAETATRFVSDRPRRDAGDRAA
ncbi:hypothetical protein [Gemmobacter denitrificans]|uniref:Uncharacterized protein n=1 Tax=Gemmobacter denitrificans TaxID=3123040 RepID=A0ABU8BZ71_9RHOB